MEIESRREKKIRQSVELLFTGLDDDTLKSIMLAVALEKSEEEKEELCKRIREKNEEDAKYYEQFQLKSVDETMAKPAVMVDGIEMELLELPIPVTTEIEADEAETKNISVDNV